MQDQYTTLSDDHKWLLIEGSKINESIVDRRGYETVEWSDGDKSGKDRLKEMNFSSRAVQGGEGSGILIPVYGSNGKVVTHQWRRDDSIEDAGGKTLRYFQPMKETTKIDVHPVNAERLRDPSVPLIITEGVKKADALASLGQCVIALPGVWNWRNKLGMLGDWEDFPLKNRQVTILFDSDGRENQSILYSMQRFRNWLASTPRHCKVRYILVPKRVGEKEVKGVDDYFAAGGTWEALSASAVDNLSSYILPNAQFSDVLMATRVANDVLEERFCWTEGTGWLEYDGGVWRTVSDNVAVEALMEYVAGNYAHAVAEFKSGNINDKSEVTGWETMLKRRKLTDVLALCRGLRGIYKEYEEFDISLDVLNTPTGLIDLTTGDLLPSSPNQMCMKKTKVEYIPGYTHPDWETALKAIPDDVREWAQIRYGQAITGYMPTDDKMIIQQGGGANGKSTITAGVSGALGGYYKLIATKVLLASEGRGGGEMPTEFMDFKGVRFAQIEELPQARRLDVNKLKQSVGTSEITARPLYKSSVTFKCTHSLFVSTNYIPIVTETDHGSWRRLALFDFPYNYVLDEDEIDGENDRLGDEFLKYRVLTDPEVHKAVLAWLVEGAVKWYEGGKTMPKMPPRIKQDTEAWRNEQDLVMGFCSDKLIPDPEGVIATKDLMEVMNEWLGETGHRTWNIENVTGRFLNHDRLRQEKIAKRKVYVRNITNRVGCTSDLGARPNAITGLRFRTKKDDTDIDYWRIDEGN